MQKVKLFKGVENELDELESEINSWIEESGAKIVNIFGNIAPQSTKPDARGTLGGAHAPSDVLMVVAYES